MANTPFQDVCSEIPFRADPLLKPLRLSPGCGPAGARLGSELVLDWDRGSPMHISAPARKRRFGGGATRAQRVLDILE